MTEEHEVEAEPEESPQDSLKQRLAERFPGPEVSLKEMLTDRRALMDATIAPFLFVGVDAIAGIKEAAIAAGAWGIGTSLYRVIKGQKVVYAISGLIGLAIAVGLALRSGNASDYFLPGVVIGLAYGSAVLATVFARRPASAWIARILEGKPREWYRTKRVHAAHMVVTAAWGSFMLARAGIRWMLIQDHRTAALAASSVILGPVATGVMAAGTYAFLRWRVPRVPDPAAEP